MASNSMLLSGMANRRRGTSPSSATLIASLTIGSAFACILAAVPPVRAASSKGCEGGGFSVIGAGPTLAGAGRYAVTSGNLQAPFLVKGKHVGLTAVPASFAVRD